MFDDKSDGSDGSHIAALDAKPEPERTAVMGPANRQPDGKRPLLRKPAPVFISGREMLDAVWRKSPWALDDDETDYGLEYEVTSNPEMWNFRAFAADVVAHGYLQASAKLEDGSFRDVVSFGSDNVALFTAMLNGSPIEVEVRKAGGLFTHAGPVETVKCELWFKRHDVDELLSKRDDVDKLRVDEVMERLAEIEADMRDDTSAVVAAAIGSWDIPVKAQHLPVNKPVVEPANVLQAKPAPSSKGRGRRKGFPYLPKAIEDVLAKRTERYSHIRDFHAEIGPKLDPNGGPSDKTVERRLLQNSRWNDLKPIR